jgi:hypothetical protein
MPNKRSTRLERALALRAPFLEFIAINGGWDKKSDGSTYFVANFAGLRVEYRSLVPTVFEPSLKNIVGVSAHDSVRSGVRYFLHVRSEHHSQAGDNVTVMVLEWGDDEEDVQLRKFLSGAWEYELAEFLADPDYLQQGGKAGSFPAEPRSPS